MSTHYDADQLRRTLPHRPPFVLLDAVDVNEPGSCGVGRKNIAISDAVFAGHFPDTAIYPGVLLIEATGHTAGIVHSVGHPDTSRVCGVLAGVSRFSFKVPVRPGDTVEFHVSKRVDLGDRYEYDARLIVDTRTVATGRIAIADIVL